MKSSRWTEKGASHQSAACGNCFSYRWVGLKSDQTAKMHPCLSNLLEETIILTRNQSCSKLCCKALFCDYLKRAFLIAWHVHLATFECLLMFIAFWMFNFICWVNFFARLLNLSKYVKPLPPFFKKNLA